MVNADAQVPNSPSRKKCAIAAVCTVNVFEILRQGRNLCELGGIPDPHFRKLLLLGCPRKLGSKFSTWVITPIYPIGYTPFTNHLLTFWDIEVAST